MKYLFCEDSKGGFELWKSVNRLLFQDYFEIVESAHGRGNLLALFEKYLPQYQASDVIMVAIDRITKSEQIVRNIEDSYSDSIMGESDPAWNNLIFTDYWCVEEILVSFAHLAEWSKVSGDIIKPWNEVRAFIKKSSEGGFDRDKH